MNPLDSLSVRDLRAVVVLAERLHFGRAALELAMAQPSLSAAVNKVERVLGTRLFERTSRRVALTPAGQLAARRIRLVLDEIGRLGGIGQAPRPILAGPFRLGLVPTIGPYYAPQFLPALKKRFPRLELLLTEALTEALLQMLRQRALDAAIVCLPTGEPGLTETPLLREPFLLAVPADHPLAAASEVSVGDLDRREMLLMERGHCLQAQALEICGAAPDTALNPRQAASVETLRHLVAAGSGCALMPSMAVGPGTDRMGLVRYLPFGEPAPSRTIGFVFHERSAHLEGAVELAAFLARHAEQSRRRKRGGGAAAAG
jgi:LysR family hydrogen peroxide-inducible transcriptional activator